MEKLMDPDTPTGVEEWLTGEFIEHRTVEDPILTKLGSLESSVNALSAFVGQVLEKQRELESLAAEKDIQALNDKVSKFESDLKIIGKTLELVLEKLIYVHAMSPFTIPYPRCDPQLVLLQVLPDAGAPQYPTAELTVAAASYSAS
ncbi:hypothetical protein HJG60_009681 [Phyllostomus discolor]|uniref:Uncharacterized protein n=1 Tax=Phyllostomus discolor TaxID=89673 RepID=A0A834EQ99_9CHIR|nr:hypothetical protein HJG60_009681 [Phyllostomus discolor]